MIVKKVLRCIAAGLMAAALLPSVACVGNVRQAAQRMQESNNLKQLALAYMMYMNDPKNKDTGPETVDEFVAWVQKNAQETSALVSDVKSGKYVFYLGVSIPKLTAGRSNTVLGYEAAVPSAGGQVVMADGSVKQMTAAEFAAAAKPPNGKLSKP
jgi:Protein of unknown function (DUF1559)